MHLYVHNNIIYNNRILEPAQLPISRWEDKKAVVHLYNGINMAVKTKKTLTLCNSTDGPGEYYANQNKPVRERQMPYGLIHVESNEQNKLTYKVKSETWNRLPAVRGEGVRDTGRYQPKNIYAYRHSPGTQKSIR